MKEYQKTRIALSAVACLVVGGTVAFADPTSSKSVTVPTMSGTYLDWMKSIDSQQGGEDLVQEPIVSVNLDGSIAGAAAQSWSVSKDKLTWTFKLRHLTWSDGTPLTAKDYVLGLQHAADPKTGYDFNWYWGTIANIKNYNEVSAGKMAVSTLGVSAPDPYTLKVTTSVPVPFLPSTMAYSFPEPQQILKKYGDSWSTNTKHMIFSGPYQVESWIPHQKIVFTLNPKYKGVRHTTIPQIVYALDNGSDYNGFKTGQVSWTQLNPGQLKAAEAGADPEGKLVQVQNFDTVMLGFNVNVKPLNNPDVRKAFSLAIDKDTLVNNVLKGNAIKSTSIVPQNFPGYDPAIKEPFNVKQAQNLLANAGYPGGKGFPTLTIEVHNDGVQWSTAQPAMEFVQAQLKQNLGITINIKPLDHATWIADLEAKKADLFLVPYNFDYLDPSDWYTQFLPGGIMTWNNTKYNKLVQVANTSFNPKQRQQLYNEAAQILNQDTGAVFLWTNTVGYLVNKNIDLKTFATVPTINPDWLVKLKVK